MNRNKMEMITPQIVNRITDILMHQDQQKYTTSHWHSEEHRSFRQLTQSTISQLIYQVIKYR